MATKKLTFDPEAGVAFAADLTLNVGADFTGTAVLSKSVIFRLAPETASGCTLHLKEVGIG